MARFVATAAAGSIIGAMSVRAMDKYFGKPLAGDDKTPSKGQQQDAPAPPQTMQPPIHPPVPPMILPMPMGGFGTFMSSGLFGPSPMQQFPQPQQLNHDLPELRLPHEEGEEEDPFERAQREIEAELGEPLV